MKVNFARLVGPAIQARAPQLELVCQQGVVTARGYSAGEIICQPPDQEVSGDDWSITVETRMLSPIKDIGDAELSIGENDGAPCLNIVSGKSEFELPAFDSQVPKNEHITEVALLLEGPVLKDALQFLAPYHNKGSKAVTGVDHGCLYLYADANNRLRMAATSSYVLAHVGGDALPSLPDDMAGIIRAGKTAFRLIPWELLTVGTPKSLSICGEGAVVEFEEGIKVVASWAETKVPDWTILTCPRRTKGWHATVSREEFTSHFKRVAAYISVVGDEALPVIKTGKSGLGISIRGGRGRIETEVPADVSAQASATYETPASGIHLRGFGPQVGMVVPKEVGFLLPEDLKDDAEPEVASSMLFWEDSALSGGTLEKNVSVVLSEQG